MVRYADHADGVLDVFRPPRGHVGRPLVVLLHGGFWRAEYDRVHVRPMAQALVGQGLTVAVPEYRRTGGVGELAGGWPATFDDLRAVMGRLPDLLTAVGVPEPGATVVVGHSAGGHLALWLAAEGFAMTRAVGLAPVADLRAAARDHLGDDAVVDLLGGTPDQVPDRYAAADPAVLLADRPAPELVVVHGCEDRNVPVTHSRALAERLPAVRLRELPDVEHFALIDPLSSAWPTVLSAVRGE